LEDGSLRKNGTARRAAGAASFSTLDGSAPMIDARDRALQRRRFDIVIEP
jgi:hypothetical protein